jgi:hypothetical protein
LKIILAAWLLGISRFEVILGLDREKEGPRDFGDVEGARVTANLQEQKQRQKQIPFGDDNQSGNDNSKSNGNGNRRSRSPSGMTTKEATTTARATATATEEADPLRGRQPKRQ